ncbi:kinase-like protein [Lindgomyces ingoldianus]|uniref:Kinase-like protein n=1 Tax=Lindgomyces ingoldianus TaxID=673940 RepID=A0ACB6R286_9PLEO|nr:kinase-like protein [Lindgomyces ingoldianus]KAF2473388.1 kinase-like protein [Lindgomyces ingoldianus]
MSWGREGPKMELSRLGAAVHLLSTLILGCTWDGLHVEKRQSTNGKVESTNDEVSRIRVTRQIPVTSSSFRAVMADSLSPPSGSAQDEAEIPLDAINLFPRKIGPRIFHLPGRGAILKVGRSVRMAEAEAMRFVSSRSSIPVPEVYEAYEKNGIGYIYMCKVEGLQLGETWSSLSYDKKAYIADQLRGYVTELRDMRGDSYGALWNQPSADIFFSHLCLKTHDNKQYGPFKSRAEYNQGLVEALTNSRPRGQLGESENSIIAKISALTEDAKVFSHGDLHLDNILVDGNCKIMAIVDWGSAGFSIPGREYLEANLRARQPEWIKLLDDVFPEDAKAEYHILKELDRALVLYSGF